MTDVKKDKNSLLASVDAARMLYTAPPAGYTGKMGVEVEMALYSVDAQGHISIPTVAQMAALHADLRARGFDAQLEAAGVLEYASQPAHVADCGALLAQVGDDLDVFAAAVRDAGLTIAPYSIVPTTTREEALEKMAQRERLVTSIGAMHDIFPRQTVEIPLLTAGIQTSFSPRDADDMFDMMRRAYLITPLLIALSNSSAGFVKNEDTPMQQNYRMRLYDGYGAAGGISPAFIAATDGDSLIDAHINAVFNAPMHFAYRPDGTLEAASPDNPLTFAGLMARGWNTQSNYELAESFLYNDIKICNLRDADGAVVGKRIEVRAADAGPCENVARAVLLAASVVPDGPMADAFEEVCARYGFIGAPADMAELLAFSRDAAINHNGNFMNVPFGTGMMRDFAADVARIIARGHAANMQIDVAALDDLCTALVTGACPAAATAGKFKTLDAVRGDLRAAATARPSLADKTPAVTPRHRDIRP